MNTISRRHFIKLLGTTAAVATVPRILQAQSSSAAGRVVIVGGGFAGATAAKYLRHWSGGNVAVTLVDTNPTHVACILSNLVLNNSLDLQEITFGYEGLRQKYGVDFIQGKAAGIDTGKLRLDDGRNVEFDRLILAPGIAFDTVPGLDTSRVPHAWQAGSQTTLLKQQLQAMPTGGVFILTIPPAPYRCPPGPYERACLVADYLKRNKPGSRVIVLDANPKIIVEEETFTKAFTQTYAGIVEYYPNIALWEVNSVQKIAKTSYGDFQADVLNVIPPHKAGSIVTDTGLTDDRWAPVNPLSYESTLQSDIHIIGDSQGTGQPKSGHIANAEAKVCADAILRAFSGESPDPAPTTNSACYSPITANTASWLTAVFRYNPNTGTMEVVPDSLGQATNPTRESYEKMFNWADNLFADTFS